MIPVAEAIRIVLAQTKALPSERVALDDALGRVLAEDVVADTDLPPFDRAQMDGYAVRSVDTADAPVRLKLVGEAAAGEGWRGHLRAGEAVRIMTGAPLPVGADGVQQVELTSEHEDGALVEIERATRPGQFYVPRGSEIRKGETVLRAGEEVNAARMAVLASFGYASVAAYRRPRVAVLATGSELVAASEQPGTDQIRDSNSYSLSAYAALAGAEVERLPFAGDDPELLRRLIEEAAGRADVLILSGGVSMGRYDFTKAALHALGAEVFFERVSLRPGKPTVFARLAAAVLKAARSSSVCRATRSRSRSLSTSSRGRRSGRCRGRRSPRSGKSAPCSRARSKARSRGRAICPSRSGRTRAGGSWRSP